MRRTVKELAEAIGARLEGDGTVELGGVAAPERAGAHDLIYVESAKHAPRAVASAAICVIAAEGVALPGKTVLRSAQPKAAFAAISGTAARARPDCVGDSSDSDRRAARALSAGRGYRAVRRHW